MKTSEKMKSFIDDTTEESRMRRDAKSDVIIFLSIHDYLSHKVHQIPS